MARERRKTKLVNSVIGAPQQLVDSGKIEELLPLVEVPTELAETYKSLPVEYANGQNRFRGDVRHVSDYLLQAKCLIRHHGVWTLTERRRGLITLLAEKGIDRIIA